MTTDRGRHAWSEELGAAQGSMVDIFLPSWAARRIPLVAGSAALLALALNVRAVRSRGAGPRPGR